MAWKKVLTEDSAVGADGLLLTVGSVTADAATLTLSDGTNTDNIVLTGGSGIDFASSGDGQLTLSVDASEITSDIQNQLTDVTLESSTSGSNVVLTLTGPGSETDTITLTAGSNITLTEAGDGSGLTIAATDTNTQLDQETVQDYAWNVLGGTQTGIAVTYQDATNDVDFVVADQTLESSTTNTDNVTLSMSNPSGTADTVELVAGTGITFSNVSAGSFEISSSTSAGTVTVADASSTNTDHYLVFTSDSLGGTAELKGDTDFKWNPSTDTLTVANLIVSGTQTTVNTNELVVADKTIVLADGSTTAANASGAGITVDVGDTANNMPEFLWDSAGQLTGWTLSNYSATGNVDFPVAIMEFSSNSTAPNGDAGGIGSFHFDTGSSQLYIRVS